MSAGSASPANPAPRGTRRRDKLLIAGLLCIHTGLLLYHGHSHTPGWDEVGHIGAGMAHVQTGIFDLYRVNPPLVRTWACLLPYAAGARGSTNAMEVVSIPGSRNEFGVGSRMIARYGPEFMPYLRLARIMCIPFSILGALCVYDLSHQIYGRKAGSGMLAVALWCFSPLVIGHGAMITPDVAATASACLLICTMIRWLRRGSWLTAILTGVVLGLCILTKLTNLILIPILCLTLGWCVCRKIFPGWKRAVVQITCIGVIAIYVINAGYGFERTGTQLGDFQFVSRLFTGASHDGYSHGNRFSETAFAELPIPLPANVLEGIDVQRRDFELGMPSYLAGEWQDHGWWYYYLYGFAVKEPAGTLILLFLSFAALPAMPRETAGRLLLYGLFPAFTIMAFVSSQTGFSHHLRYLLPAYPFLYVAASGMVVPDRRWVIRVATVCVTMTITSALMACPHSISFFNLIVGGPLNGPAHLHNSNVDWGQDVLFLHDWLEQHPETRPIQVDVSSGFNPASLSNWDDDIIFRRIDRTTAKLVEREEKTSPWYAIGVGHLYDPPGIEDRYHSFRDTEPTARVGYTIRIYER